MPIHDWTLVDGGIFHAFHHDWITAISRTLNLGLLPTGYYALSEQTAGSLGPDVLTLSRPNHNGLSPVQPVEGGGPRSDASEGSHEDARRSESLRSQGQDGSDSPRQQSPGGPGGGCFSREQEQPKWLERLRSKGSRSTGSWDPSVARRSIPSRPTRPPWDSSCRLGRGL